MADHEKVDKITSSLAELFPERKNELEKRKVVLCPQLLHFLGLGKGS